MAKRPYRREHGTPRGYAQHNTRREPACGACLAANAKEQHRERWRGRCAPGLGWPALTARESRG